MSAPTILEPQAHVWTRDEYLRAGELGLFRDRRVQLIEGEILDMPPLGNQHCISTECTARALRDVFGAGFWVRVQIPLDLSPLRAGVADYWIVNLVDRQLEVHRNPHADPRQPSG